MAVRRTDENRNFTPAATGPEISHSRSADQNRVSTRPAAMNNRGHCLTSFDTGLHSWAGCSLQWPASGWRASYRSKFLRLSRDSRRRFRRRRHRRSGHRREFCTSSVCRYGKQSARPHFNSRDACGRLTVPDCGRRRGARKRLLKKRNFLRRRQKAYILKLLDLDHRARHTECDSLVIRRGAECDVF